VLQAGLTQSSVCAVKTAPKGQRRDRRQR
jgi:hypothetical protein